VNARTLLSSVFVALALVALGGCGSDSPTSAATPEIRAALLKVDNAIVDEKHPKAALALQELKRLVNQARRAGTLRDEQADAILAAADRLMSRLVPEESETPGSETPEPETASPSAVESEPEAADKPTPDEKPDPSKSADEPDKNNGPSKPEKPEKPAKPDDPGNSEDAPGHSDD